MTHLTVNTGHSRWSPRAEVSDRVLPLVAPLLEPGEHPVPNLPGWRVVVPSSPAGWLATVYHGDIPVVTVGVADTPEAAAVVWDALAGLYAALPVRGGPGATERPDRLPWCAAVLVTPAGGQDWIGDLERCLAWAWLERPGAKKNDRPH